MNKVIIIGSGPAGLGTAYHLRGNGSTVGINDFKVFEQDNSPGGLMRSKNVNGFIFDYAGHIFFTNDQYARDLVEGLLGDNIIHHERESWIYSKNVYTRYPFQANTYGLPREVIKDCILGLIEAKYGEKKLKVEPNNFEEWIYSNFGWGIAKHFMIPYNTKLWTIPLTEIAHDWLSVRVPQPKLEDVITGALQLGRKDLGPNAYFAYPRYGGCASIVNAFLAQIGEDRVETSCRVTKVDLKNKEIIINGSRKESYQYLVSTMPLPELVKATDQAPEQIIKAVQALRSMSVICGNIGIGRGNATEKNWIYYPEAEFIFHRIFVQGNTSPEVLPNQNCSSFTAEISYGNNKYLNKSKVLEDTIEGLIKVGLMQPEDQVLAEDVVDIPYGYVIYEPNRKKNVDLIKDYYQKYDVYLTGRFAEWEYYNMDHSILAGRRTAEELLKKI